MNLISIDNVSKTVNEEPLFTEVSFGIDEDDHIGFVGPNGSGKSTFLKLLIGETPSDTGTIARSKNMYISVLPQRPAFSEHMTVKEFLYQGEDPLLRLVGEYEASLAQVMHSHKTGSGITNAEKELAHLTYLMETQNGFGVEHTYQSFLNELGITDLNAPLKTFSGGMVKKVALARAFTSQADLLLLDEPTNHLDIDTIEWLERKLLALSGAFILVTHDRYFLDRVCTKMLDIDHRHIQKYDGNFSIFLRRKRERAEEEERHDIKREAILRVELEWLKRGPKARSIKDAHRKERVHALLAERRDDSTEMEDFSVVQKKLGGKILKLENISKAWTEQPVIQNFSYNFSKGERIGIIGGNGTGKSTFLDILAGRIQADSGTIDFGIHTHIGYFDQTALHINTEQTVLEFMRETAERVHLKDGETISIEQFLDRFLFPRNLFFTALSRLSGGELRRLQLIQLLASEPNFLLFDEPTNDFDIETISLLEDFLQDFSGCLLVVSHDRAFLDSVADFLFYFDGSGGIEYFAGNYSDYKNVQTIKTENDQSVQLKKEQTHQIKPKCEKKEKLSFKEQKEFDSLLDEIDSLEQEKADLEKKFSESYIDEGQTAQRYALVCTLIEEKTNRWEELSDVLT